MWHALLTHLPLTFRPGHCRRRKIRCLVAEDDPQNRCQNCIRLKKECYFYPVDQQVPAENRSQSSVNINTESVPSSAVSPSPEGQSRSFEPTQDISSYQPLSSNAPTLYRQAPENVLVSNTIQNQGTFKLSAVPDELTLTTYRYPLTNRIHLSVSSRDATPMASQRSVPGAQCFSCGRDNGPSTTVYLAIHRTQHERRFRAISYFSNGH